MGDPAERPRWIEALDGGLTADEVEDLHARGRERDAAARRAEGKSGESGEDGASPRL